MKYNYISWLKRIQTFISKISWLSVILGAVVSVPLWWMIKALLYPSKSSQEWEFALGVILGAIAGWIIPEAIDATKVAWKTSQPLKRILGPACNSTENTVIFLGSLYPKDITSFVKSVPLTPAGTFAVVPKHGMPWVLVENDARALGYTMAMLAKAGKSEYITILRDDQGLEITDANLICIGSPKSNYKTKQINDVFENIPVRFEQKGDTSTIYTIDREHVWMADEIYDYAVLIKMPNEYNKSKVVFIIGGISHPGTAGAAYYLWKRWTEILLKPNQDFFALVLKVRRDNFQYVQIEYSINFS